jgi:hypothetical protein
MNSFGLRLCRVPGCTFPKCLAGKPHHCKVCNNYGVTHFSTNCPLLLNRVRRCKAPDCTARKCLIDGLPHYCNKCKNPDSDHRAKNCPFARHIVMAPMRLVAIPVPSSAFVRVVKR